LCGYFSVASVFDAVKTVHNLSMRPDMAQAVRP
jgi:hypothetical protein